MRRKLAMIAAFVVAMTGAIVTKASVSTTYVTTTNCAIVVPDCPGGSVNCGYIKGACGVNMQKHS